MSIASVDGFGLIGQDQVKRVGCDYLRRVFLKGAMLVGISACGLARAGGNEVEIRIKRFSIAPDGRTVAFEYLHPTLGRSLGLWEWQTGKLRHVPAPAGTSAPVNASFTPDGKRLLAVAWDGKRDQLVGIDLLALEAVRLANLNGADRKSTRLNSSHTDISRMPSSA